MDPANEVWRELALWLVGLAQLAIAGGVAWLVRTGRQLRTGQEDQGERLAKLERAVLGEAGTTNGLATRVEKLERSRHGLRNVLQDVWQLLVGHDDELAEHHGSLAPEKDRREHLPGRRVTDLTGWRDA